YEHGSKPRAEPAWPLWQDEAVQYSCKERIATRGILENMITDRGTIQKAQRFLAAGKIQLAIQENLKVLRETPNDQNLIFYVADLYGKTGQSTVAIPLLQRVAEHHCNEGFLLKAIAMYKRIHKLDPGLVETRIQLSDVYLRQGLITEARFELL